jgi:hypothetical protein
VWGEQRLDALPMKNSGCVVVQSEVWRKTNGYGHRFAWEAEALLVCRGLERLLILS